jgi:site-specific recombinase XerD
MNGEIMKAYQQYLRGKYRKSHTRKNYYRFVNNFQEWLSMNKGKSIEELKTEDTQEYRVYCQERYSVNGNVGRLNALNNFTGKFLGRKDLLVNAPESEPSNKQVLSKEELSKYITAAETSLEKMVVSLQVDGLLRPAEICELKLSNIDFENRKLYLDDTKSGNKYIIMSKSLAESITDYKKNRMFPKNKEDEDRLIIINKGNRSGFPPKSSRPDFVYNLTKRLAIRAKIKRNVYPYLIKPSVITGYFNDNVNPKTIQRMARHKYIETTLRYDHTDDMTVKEFFDKQNSKLQVLENDNKVGLKEAAEVIQGLINGEIDIKELAKEIETLKHKEHKDDMAYT